MSNVQRRDGDWECPHCNNLNFARRSECHRCRAPRSDGGGGGFGCSDFYGHGDYGNSRDFGGYSDVRPGDWECPSCFKNVFASKSSCFNCGTPKPSDAGSSNRGGNQGGSYGGDWGNGGKRDFGGDWGNSGKRNYGGGFAGYGGGDVRPGDWECPSCHRNVFASKSVCFNCGTAKPSDNYAYGNDDDRGNFGSGKYHDDNRDGFGGASFRGGRGGYSTEHRGYGDDRGTGRSFGQGWGNNGGGDRW